MSTDPVDELIEKADEIIEEETQTLSMMDDLPTDDEELEEIEDPFPDPAGLELASVDPEEFDLDAFDGNEGWEGDEDDWDMDQGGYGEGGFI